MRVVDIIGRKRDGFAHTDEELQFLIRGFALGQIPDYQMSSWLMAVVCRGLNEHETFALTDAMVRSGETLDLSNVPGFSLDKHSTGGVGDKTTMAVVPILASLGIVLPKMSGRGLGHTGGTLDKLESIPGTNTDIAIPDIIKQLRSIGGCLCAQTNNLVPADSKMYALRDASGTVNSLPLIAASIMSKKIASGASAILLDVKVGRGAFMQHIEDARALANLMIRIGLANGRRVVAVISDMNHPLGYNIGNLLEIREVVTLLKDNPWCEPRFKELVKHLCSIGLAMAGITETIPEGKDLAQRQIESGAALAKLSDIVAMQGGDIEILTHTIKQPTARVKFDVKIRSSGVITALDADKIGEAAMRLGAGRSSKDDLIDPTAGILLRKHLGSRVVEGTVVATLHAPNEVLVRQVEDFVHSAFHLVDDGSYVDAPLIYETIGTYN